MDVSLHCNRQVRTGTFEENAVEATNQELVNELISLHSQLLIVRLIRKSPNNFISELLERAGKTLHKCAEVLSMIQGFVSDGGLLVCSMQDFSRSTTVFVFIIIILFCSWCVYFSEMMNLFAKINITSWLAHFIVPSTFESTM